MSEKWCRFRLGDRTAYGVVEGETVVEAMGSPFETRESRGIRYPLTSVKLLPPVVPSNFWAAGPNYRGHIEAMAARRGQPPTYPVAPSPNQRAVNALIGHRDDIVIPKDSSGAVQPEGQLAVVIGKQARNVSKENALDYVFGYTIGNDISQRVWQQTDRTLWRCKNADTFKPLGPWIATNLDPSDLRIIVRHNGAVTQDFSSADQIWDVATWIHELTKYMTLTPGDILWMGTQGADGDMVAGDVIEVEIDGIGVLRNQVVAEG